MLILKRLLLVLIFLLTVITSYEQSAVCTFPCGSLATSSPLVDDYLNDVTIKHHINYGKIASGYTDPTYKGDYAGEEGDDAKCNVVKNYFTGSEPSFEVLCNNELPGYDINDVLYYDVYYSTKYTAQQYKDCPLPCIIYFHGSGFSDCVDMASDVSFLRKLAARHFVVINVEYRRGKVFAGQPTLYYSVQQMLAIYRAFQDGRGAIRSIIKRQNNEGTGGINDYYRIDINNIFLGGASAGSAIALNAAYYTNPNMVNAILPNIASALGPIDADFYYGEPTISYSSKIKGVLNQWGNVFVPTAYRNNPIDFFLNYLTQVPPPLISFHGLKDDVAFFDINDIFFPPSTSVNYNTESDCVLNPYTVDGIASTIDLVALGSNQLYQIFTDSRINQFTELYVDCDAKHGLRNPGKRGFYGLCTINQFDTQTYIAERATTFFQAKLTNNINLNGVKKFVDCKNTRFGCPWIDSNEGCTNGDDCPNDDPCPVNILQTINQSK